jgi:diguanylate cyclase (GGDEF)-like protein
VNQELELLSLYDSLTQLPNRSLFRDRVNQAIGIARREDAPLSLLLVDLDQFKEINDTLGHETGDLLLKEVADRFAGQLGYADTVSRLGSDEFGLLLTHADTEAARAFADRLLRVLEAPFRHGRQELSISAGIGIATFPGHGGDATTLMRHADLAMYRAKRNRLNVAAYDERQHEDSPRRLLLRGNLRRGLAGRQFLLHYQPKIDLGSRRLVGVEALARWRHPEQGLIMPDVFIPALEDNGLINAFNLWALDTALAQAAAWRQRGIELRMSVNMSVLSLLNPASFGEIEALLAGSLTGSPAAGRLMLEITENLFLSDYGRLGDALTRLRGLGVSFSIDDFGTGHSSLARLRKLPVNELKIDRSFVTDMANNPDDAIIVRSTIDLAHNLGLSVVAEGVENAAVLDRLAAMGCDVVQGYHLGRPMPADDLERLARDNGWLP